MGSHCGLLDLVVIYGNPFDVSFLQIQLGWDPGVRGVKRRVIDLTDSVARLNTLTIHLKSITVVYKEELLMATE